jgi:hypothetical protein
VVRRAKRVSSLTKDDQGPLPWSASV